MRKAHNTVRSPRHPLRPREGVPPRAEVLSRGCPVFAPGSPKIPLFPPFCRHALRSHSGLSGRPGVTQMTIKASGHSALILATGLFVCFAAPSQAAEEADAAGAQSETAGPPLGLHTPAKHGSLHPRKHAHRESRKVADTSSHDQKPDEVAVDNGASAAAITPSVADANARLTSAGTPVGNAKATSAPPNDVLQTAPSAPWEAQPAPESE